MIHAPDDTDSIIARRASRPVFFNSLGYKRKSGRPLERVRFRPLSRRESPLRAFSRRRGLALQEPPEKLPDTLSSSCPGGMADSPLARPEGVRNKSRCETFVHQFHVSNTPDSSDALQGAIQE